MSEWVIKMQLNIKQIETNCCALFYLFTSGSRKCQLWIKNDFHVDVGANDEEIYGVLFSITGGWIDHLHTITAIWWPLEFVVVSVACMRVCWVFYHDMQTKYVDGTPTSEVTPGTIPYIHPPHYSHTSQYHDHEWMTHIPFIPCQAAVLFLR